MINKYQVDWQIIRVKARKEKGAKNKVSIVMDWLSNNTHENNYERVKNWLNMSRMGYRNEESKLYYTKALQGIEVISYTIGEENNDLSRISDNDLLMIYKDLGNRKWGFQYAKAPISHIDFMDQLEYELVNRDII
tara:strand:- start:2335 stop:2739 length:405 start_codon:yes stop_codon:yes gene_type:complete